MWSFTCLHVQTSTPIPLTLLVWSSIGLDKELNLQSSDIKDDGMEGEGDTPELLIMEQAHTASTGGVCRR